MLHIRLVVVGGLRERYWEHAAAEYSKRMTKYCKFEVIEVKETSQIRDKIKGHSILCDIQGTLVSSEEMAAKIAKISLTSSTITFIIGGSEGAGELSADERISFGRATYPHQLFRVILTEQIYRAFTIIKGEKYHK